MTNLIILLIPLVGTSLGAATVFFLKSNLPERLEKALLGFASGIMIAASVWSLLIPAIEMSERPAHPVLSVIPAVLGFLSGVAFLLLMDSVVPHLHPSAERPEGLRAALPKTAMMLFAVTLHNLPEGMAVGVTCAGVGSTGSITFASALALSVGVAIQNFPEGAIVSLPLYKEGFGRWKSFLGGVISGVVEPVGGVLILLFTSLLSPLMPYFLAFAAGAMIYVVSEELIPEAQSGEQSNIGTVGVSLGFVLMMVLDVILG